MSKESATNFFAIFYGGKHHFPGRIKKCGYGWEMNDRYALSTSDYGNLTKLVLMAHKYAVRVELMPSGPGMIKVCIWQREREGSMDSRHPDIYKAIEDIKLPETIQ